MNVFPFFFCGAALQALPSGAVFWPEYRLLVVSDLHFGKAARLAAQGGAALPPYDTTDTLLRLERDIEATASTQVLCLGDSFDAPGFDVRLPEHDRLWITRLQAGRHWVWIEGNHDPGPVALGGTHLAEMTLGPLTFRHVARDAATAEVSGHYHPKARLNVRGRTITRPCLLIDDRRLLLPAYGTYTGGLFCHSDTLSALMASQAQAILTGPRPVAIPMPR